MPGVREYPKIGRRSARCSDSCGQTRVSSGLPVDMTRTMIARSAQVTRSANITLEVMACVPKTASNACSP
jgi:hypothetical protein